MTCVIRARVIASPYRAESRPNPKLRLERGRSWSRREFQVGGSIGQARRWHESRPPRRSFTAFGADHIGLPHALGVLRGIGGAVNVNPGFPDVIAGPVDNIRVNPCLAVPLGGAFVPNAGGPNPSLHGRLAGNSICLLIDRDWAACQRIKLNARIHTTRTCGEDTNFSDLVFTVQGSRVGCALRPCQLIEQAFRNAVREDERTALADPAGCRRNDDRRRLSGGVRPGLMGRTNPRDCWRS